MGNLVKSLVNSIASINALLVLLILFIFIFALLGMQIFGGRFKNEESRGTFNNFGQSCLTVFQVDSAKFWPGLNPFLFVPRLFTSFVISTTFYPVCTVDLLHDFLNCFHGFPGRCAACWISHLSNLHSNTNLVSPPKSKLYLDIWLSHVSFKQYKTYSWFIYWPPQNKSNLE